MRFSISYNMLRKVSGIVIVFIVLTSVVSAGYLVNNEDIKKARSQIYDITALNNIQTSNYMGNRGLLSQVEKNKVQENNVNILRLKRYNFEIPAKLEDLTLKLSS
jgi:hypothetical protein